MSRIPLIAEDLKVETFETVADFSFAMLQPVGAETPHPACADSPLCVPTFQAGCQY